MKRIIILSAALLVLFTGRILAVTSHHLDTAWGGQHMFFSEGKFILAPGDSVTVYAGFATSPSFITTYLSTTGHTFVNTSSTPDTIAFRDTTSTTSVGNKWVKWFITSATGTDTTNYFGPVFVDSIWGSPTMPITGNITPNYSGGVLSIPYNCEGPAGTITIYEHPGDTLWTDSFLVATYPVTGAGTITHTYTGYGSGAWFASKVKLTTSMGTVLSSKKWAHVLTTPTAPSPSSVDSFVLGPDTIKLHNVVVHYGTTCTVTVKYGLSGGALTDSVTRTLTGTSNWMVIPGLIPTTSYDFRICARDSLGSNCTTTLFTASTTPIPTILSKRIDSTKVINPTTLRVWVTTTVPAGMTGDVGVLVAHGPDSLFTLPILISPLTAVGSGIVQNYFDMSPLSSGDDIRVGAYLIPSSGLALDPDPGIRMTFTVPAPSVDSIWATPSHIANGARTHIHFKVSGRVHASLTGMGALTNDTGSYYTDSLFTSTWFYLRVTGMDSSIAIDSQLVVVDSAVDTTTPTLICGYGVNSESSYTVKVYPNPCSEKIMVSTNQTKESGQITDMNGRVLKTFMTADKGEQIISVAELPNGEYLLSIVSRKFTEKITIQH